MSRQPTLTIAVIALNEAAQMPGWLAATAWADEQLVVDGGSHDTTALIAERHGARVLTHTFDNFAAQRNRALQAASSDWVLFVDADERPSPALRCELLTRLSTAREGAFRVPIRSTIFGRRFRFCGTQDDRPTRLVRRGQGAWVGAVHERYECAGVRGTITAHLDHTTIPDLATFQRKVERYTSLQAEQRVLDRRAPRWRERLIAPPREVFRRLLWKHGWLDGPEGWAFAVLSGWSEWVLARKHAQRWRERLKEAQKPPALALCGRGWLATVGREPGEGMNHVPTHPLTQFAARTSLSHVVERDSLATSTTAPPSPRLACD